MGVHSFFLRVYSNEMGGKCENENFAVVLKGYQLTFNLTAVTFCFVFPLLFGVAGEMWN